MMRSEEEIQKAHNLLQSVLDEPGLSPQNHQTIASLMNALCWVLGHSNGFVLGRTLASFETLIDLMEHKRKN